VGTIFARCRARPIHEAGLVDLGLTVATGVSGAGERSQVHIRSVGADSCSIPDADRSPRGAFDPRAHHRRDQRRVPDCLAPVRASLAWVPGKQSGERSNTTDSLAIRGPILEAKMLYDEPDDDRTDAEPGIQSSPTHGGSLDDEGFAAAR
jgi:hypothetical protein